MMTEAVNGKIEDTITTCSDTPCTEAPFTHACSAVNDTNVKEGVICEALHTEATCVAPLVWTPETWTSGTTAELNYLDTVAGTSEASKAIVYGIDHFVGSLKTFGTSACTDPEDCETKCLADAACEGYSRTVSYTHLTLPTNREV